MKVKFLGFIPNEEIGEASFTEGKIYDIEEFLKDGYLVRDDKDSYEFLYVEECEIVEQ